MLKLAPAAAKSAHIQLPSRVEATMPLVSETLAPGRPSLCTGVGET